MWRPVFRSSGWPSRSRLGGLVSPARTPLLLPAAPAPFSSSPRTARKTVDGYFRKLLKRPTSSEYKRHELGRDPVPTWVRLRALAPTCTQVDVVRGILEAGPTGKIISLDLTPAGGNERSRGHPLYAQASIEFDDQSAAARLEGHLRANRFFIGGVQPLLRVDIKKLDPLEWAPGSRLYNPQSRVLLIRDTPENPLMTVPALRAFFRDHGIDDEAEHTEVRSSNGYHAHKIILWRFCSWRYQARLAFRALRDEQTVGVFYHPDPCETGLPVLMRGDDGPKADGAVPLFRRAS